MANPLWTRSIAWLGIVALLAPATIAVAQQAVTLADVISGKAVPLSMKPADLPLDYKAVHIKVTGAGGGGIMDMLAGFMSPMASLMGGNSSPDNPGAALLAASDVSWTKGDIVKVQNKDFLVTYKWSLDLTQGPAPGDSTDQTKGKEDALRSADLALSLVAIDAVSTFSPATGFTKAKFLELIDKAVEAVKSQPATEATAAVGTTAPAETETADTDQGRALQNVKQIATGLSLYANDYDEVLPYAQSTMAVKFVTLPYVKSEEVWKTLNPVGSQFLFNMALAGVKTSDVPSPAETVLFYEDKPWGDGRRVVAFADTHTQFVSSDEWAKLEPTLHLKLPKSAKPLPLRYGMDGG